MRPSNVLGLALLAGSALADLPPIEAKGSRMFYSNNGTQLYVASCSSLRCLPRLSNSSQLHARCRLPAGIQRQYLR